MKISADIISALIVAQWKSLMRDRLALLLTFFLPCILFTVLAVIFSGVGGSGGSGGSISNVDVLFLDFDKSTVSDQMLSVLGEMDGVKLKPVDDEENTPAADTSPEQQRLALATAIRRGDADAAVLIPQGIENSIASFTQDRPAIEVIYDSANPVAQQMLMGVLQGAAFTSAPDILMDKGLDQFEQFGGPLTEQQVTAMRMFRTLMSGSTDGNPYDGTATDDDSNATAGITMENGLVRIESTAARDVSDDTPAQTGLQRQGAMVSYYAAGIAVMFLMFSMAGAAASLIEHEENGTLDRLLTGRLTVGGLVITHWLFYSLMGVLQVAVMFAFAALTFGLDLWHVDTLISCGILSVCTSFASAAFIMMLATLCSSRKQLEGLSTIIILIMSAFGGSMVPRFVMPEFVHQTSRLTFNGWALDGFLKVFWYNVPGESTVMSILPEAGVLLGMAAGFLLVAVQFARRWSVA